MPDDRTSTGSPSMPAASGAVPDGEEVADCEARPSGCVWAALVETAVGALVLAEACSPEGALAQPHHSAPAQAKEKADR